LSYSRKQTYASAFGAFFPLRTFLCSISEFLMYLYEENELSPAIQFSEYSFG